MSRIAILEKDKCQPKKCNYACIEYCPGVRMEEDTIIISEDDKNQRYQKNYVLVVEYV